MANFGRLLTGTRDALPGFVAALIEIADEATVSLSGKTHHSIAKFTGQESDSIEGTVFAVTARGTSQCRQIRGRRVQAGGGGSPLGNARVGVCRCRIRPAGRVTPAAAFCLVAFCLVPLPLRCRSFSIPPDIDGGGANATLWPPGGCDVAPSDPRPVAPSLSVARSPMKAARGTAPATADPEKQLDAFIAKFGVEDQRRIRAVRRAVRKRFPSANELVYDNYNFFVIGYSPTERPSDSIVSIAATGERHRPLLHLRRHAARSTEDTVRRRQADALSPSRVSAHAGAPGS